MTEETIEQLLNRKQPLAFLVGAGISLSRPSKMLSGGQFNQEIIRRIALDDQSEKELLPLCDSERYDRENKGDFFRFEGLMQLLQDTVDPNLHLLDCLSYCAIPNEYHYTIALLIRHGHKIFTTNIDMLIEYACQQMKIPFFALIDENNFRDYSKSLNPHPLFKLHGSLRMYEGGDWIDSRESVKATLKAIGKPGDAMQFEPGKRKVINSVLQECDLVIMGYSGYDDFDICPTIESISSDKRLIWINHINEKERGRQYSWYDLENAPRDKNGDFLRKRDEHLYKIGRVARRPENIFLFDIDSAKIIAMLRRIYGLHKPDLGDQYKFDREHFFGSWEKDHIKNEGDKPFMCGKAYYSLKRHSQALDMFKIGLSSYEGSGYRIGVGDSLHHIAMIHRVRAEYRTALSYFQRSLALFQELVDERRISISFLNIGGIHFELGDYDIALDYYKSIDVGKSVDDKTGIAACLHQIGMIHRVRGEYRRALDYCQRSLEIAESLGNMSGIANIYGQIGNVYISKQEYERALEYYERSLHIRETLGDRSGIAICYHNIGLIHQSRKDDNKALEYYQKSLSLAEDLGERCGVSAGLHQKGNLHYLKGEYDRALECYQKSLYWDEKSGDKLGAASCYNNLGKLYKQKKNYQNAVAYFHRAARIFKDLKSPDLEKTTQNLKEVKQTLGIHAYNQYLRKAEQIIVKQEMKTKQALEDLEFKKSNVKTPMST